MRKLLNNINRLAVVAACALPAAGRASPSPEALCARMVALAGADPTAPAPLPPEACAGLLAAQQASLGPAGFAAFAACIQAAQVARDVDACNPARFAPAGPPAPAPQGPLPAVPAAGPLPGRVLGLLKRLVALADRHAPACEALNAALDLELATHEALVERLGQLKAGPEAARIEALAPAQAEITTAVGQLIPVVGACQHPLLVRLITSL